MKKALVLLCALGLLAACDNQSSSKATATTPKDSKSTDTKAAPTKDAPKKDAPAPDKGAAKPPAAPKAPALNADGSVKPDDASTAKLPPKAADLARYTADLGEGTLMARIVTSMGEFTCELYEKDAPMTVANFVGLARGLKAWTNPKNGKPQVGTPLYKDIKCHRVIPNFMIQCGDPLGVGMGGPGYRFADEINKNKHVGSGILSMANAGPATNGSQFFITEVSTPHLNAKHTVFGKCDNAPLVKEIARVKTAPGNRPLTDVLIKKIEVKRVKK